MPANAAINDNYAYETDALEEEVISSAVLVAAAFRLRDEEALVDMLRRLTTSVTRLEQYREDYD